MQTPVVSDFSSGSSDGPAFDKAQKIDQPQLKALPTPSATAKTAPEPARSTGVVAGAFSSAPRSQSTVPAQSSQSLARRAFVGPRWGVSDAGAVQRSYDGGRSWKEVPVAEGVTFRAVAVVMTDVWAGGSGGALFHSTDSGEHWARARVQVNDRTLSGDIVRIELADAQNLVVTTSTAETWTTSDAGATWRPQ